MSRTIRLSLMAVLAIVISGCVHESADGDTRVFTYDLWVSLTSLLGGIAAIPIGLAIRNRMPKFGWFLLIAGPIAAIGIAPSMFLERTTLSDKTFAVRTGIWGMTSVHSVNLDDLTQVRLVMEQTTGRRGRTQENYYLMCHRKDGTVARIPVNNNIAEVAAPEFINLVRQRNIPIVDETSK